MSPLRQSIAVGIGGACGSLIADLPAMLRGETSFGEAAYQAVIVFAVAGFVWFLTQLYRHALKSRVKK